MKLPNRTTPVERKTSKNHVIASGGDPGIWKTLTKTMKKVAKIPKMLWLND